MAKTNNKESVINYIGTCPICGKGKIAEGPTVYRCNYAASIEDKCDFHVFKTYNGAEIKPKHVQQLIKDGKTEIIEFTSKAGKKFNGYLVIENGDVRMQFANDPNNLTLLDAPCPICGAQMAIYNNGYACTNFHEMDEEQKRKCSLWINKNIAGRIITKEEVEQLLLEGKTDFLDGFTNNSGSNFSSRLVINDEGVVSFDSTICKCPKCGGDIKIGTKSYNCSNWKTNGCNFTVWREIAYRKITPDEVKQLCENGGTEVLEGFKNKDKSKTFSGQLMLSDDYQVKIL